jgi:exosortase
MIGAAAIRLLVSWPVMLALGAALFWPTWGWMAQRFQAADSFYSHGWLIPLASAWLIWQRRGILRGLPLRPTFSGWWLLLPMLGLHLAASWWKIHFVSGFAMVGTVWALVWTCWGAAAVRALRVPLAFLAFMVPLPGVLLIGTSFHMKLAAASLATRALSLLGVPVAQAGSTLLLPGLSVIVDDTCSGLRTLISLVALAALWAALLPPGAPRWARALTVASSVPIALAANMARILVLIGVALLWGPAAARSFLHYGSGLIVFGVALGLLMWLGRGLTRRVG